jgi:hypothetical protein
MFIAALFTTTKVWKQLRCPTGDECIKKCHIYIQWNFIQPQRRMKFCNLQVWMELENVILNEVSQVQKAQSSMFSLISVI